MEVRARARVLRLGLAHPNPTPTPNPTPNPNPHPNPNQVELRGRRIPGSEGQLATEVSSEGLVQATLSLRKHVRAWTHRQVS